MNKFDKILILGSGLSAQHGSNLQIEHVIKKLITYPNIILSDISISEKFKDVMHVKLKLHSIKNISIKLYEKYNGLIKDYPNMYTPIKYEDWKHKFKLIDLLDDKSLNRLELYDYIECRYVLHLSLFSQAQRKKIIEILYNKLNINGILDISCYHKLSEVNDAYVNNYNLITDEEIEFYKSLYELTVEYTKDSDNIVYQLLIRKTIKNDLS